MHLRDVFGPSSISLNGEVNAGMATLLDQELRKQPTGTNQEPLIIVISSLGGSVPFGESIAERIRIYNQLRTIHIVAVGRIGSAATLFPLAVPRAQRFLTRNTIVNLHQFTIDASLPRQVLVGAEFVAEEIGKNVFDLRKTYDRYLKKLSHDMKCSMAKTRRLVDYETFLSAKEVVRLGLFHTIIG